VALSHSFVLKESFANIMVRVAPATVFCSCRWMVTFEVVEVKRSRNVSPGLRFEGMIIQPSVSPLGSVEVSDGEICLECVALNLQNRYPKPINIMYRRDGPAL
jgi:hypothetical protein